jgi:hypothetical protein
VTTTQVLLALAGIIGVRFFIGWILVLWKRRQAPSPSVAVQGVEARAEARAEAAHAEVDRTFAAQAAKPPRTREEILAELRREEQDLQVQEEKKR